MNTEDVLEEFRGAGALREGHFILASGRHSPVFLQKNLVFQYPERTARLCKALAEKIEAQFGKPDVIVAPAVGAIIPGYEVARWLGAQPQVLDDPAKAAPATWACRPATHALILGCKRSKNVFGRPPRRRRSIGSASTPATTTSICR